MRAAIPALFLTLSLAACGCISRSAVAQEANQPIPKPIPGSAIPDVPSPTLAASANSAQLLPSEELTEPAAESVPGYQPGASLTLHDRFILEARTTFSPSVFVVPAAEAAFTMADPPRHYPREWRDGAGAFGRNYGADLTRHTTGGLTHFATAAILREDPRYYPSTSTNPAGRFVHALGFTLVDLSDSGRHTVAFSNLAGSAAAGAIGMAIYPNGMNDLTHASQRAAVELGRFGAHNVIAEFSPEIAHILHKLHFPDRIANSVLPLDRKEPQTQP
jgi:hypothetical protein